MLIPSKNIDTSAVRGLAIIHKTYAGWEVRAADPDGQLYVFGQCSSKVKAQAVANFANSARSYDTQFTAWLNNYQTTAI